MIGFDSGLCTYHMYSIDDFFSAIPSCFSSFAPKMLHTSPTTPSTHITNTGSHHINWTWEWHSMQTHWHWHHDGLYLSMSCHCQLCIHGVAATCQHNHHMSCFSGFHSKKAPHISTKYTCTAKPRLLSPHQWEWHNKHIKIDVTSPYSFVHHAPANNTFTVCRCPA